jgi:hypothetical protein
MNKEVVKSTILTFWRQKNVSYDMNSHGRYSQRTAPDGAAAFGFGVE